MMAWLGVVLLLAGALLCLVAAVGVLRLPDFFMRMHAATKAGVVGSGLVLLGVAALDGGLATGIKAIATVLFLLLTTPVAGHLIGRAGYVSGQPLWRGTQGDALDGVLERATFEADRAASPPPAPAVKRVVLLLADCPGIDQAIVRSVALARQSGAELCGLALIDIDRLQNVGPVPIGAGWHAQQMRERRIAQARRCAADVLQRFETTLRGTDVVWSSRLAEGPPRRLLREIGDDDDLVVAAADGWFDQGVLDLRVDVASRLDWTGRHPLQVLR